MATLSDFDDIRPYSDGELHQALSDLLADRQFRRLLKSYVPWLPPSAVRGLLRMSFIGLKTTLGFQKRFMAPIVRHVLKKYSDGCRFENHKSNTYDKRYIFVSNHRDIVLDPAILDYKLVKDGSPASCEIAIGDNLLIYPWIRCLVRINKSFVVRRSLSPREMLKSSKHMSEYIHFAINEKHENIWLAQREGRAKDSDDRTQESVLKMLALGYEGSPLEGLRNVNIVPLTISYEYDPCDYLKAKEFQLKRDNPAYRKTKQDDLENMKVGIKGYKGRIVYRTAPCINAWLGELADLKGHEFFQETARRIDKAIHSNYEIYPNNYIALDMLNGDEAFADRYSAEDKAKFESYLQAQLEKIDIENKDDAFLMERMLTMYANPLRNHLTAAI
jgi:hypothetical protein